MRCENFNFFILIIILMTWRCWWLKWDMRNFRKWRCFIFCWWKMEISYQTISMKKEEMVKKMKQIDLIQIDHLIIFYHHSHIYLISFSSSTISTQIKNYQTSFQHWIYFLDFDIILIWNMNEMTKDQTNPKNWNEMRNDMVDEMK